MMNNMFTIFDPLILNYPLNYFFYMIFLMNFLNLNFWFINNNNPINFLLKKIYFYTINNNKIMNKSLINLFNSLFMLMIIINMMNINPNLFYISSNIMFTLNLSFFFIMNIFLFNLFNNYKIFLMNLTPKNTPLFLIFLINFIELNSFFIQILTLSLRLMINMMLGHIIMIILNNYILIYLYLMIEIFIILIQSYIFFLLNLLNSNNMY